MSLRIEAFSITDNAPHQVRLFNEGAQVGSTFNAVSMGAGTFGYYFDVPGTPAAGHYSFALYLSASGALRSQGEFDWDGAAIIQPRTSRPTTE